MMRSRFGIAEMQKRNTSHVQAARASASVVPSAKAVVENMAIASIRTVEGEVSFQIRFMRFSTVAVLLNCASLSQ